MQESTIRYILLFFGVLVIIGLLWNGLRRDKKARTTKEMTGAQRPGKMERSSGDSLGELVKPMEEEPLADTFFQMEGEKEPILKEEVLEDLVKEDNKEEVTFKADTDIISLYVMAKKGKHFGGYDLLQTILDHDMQYGDMQIFHHYQDNEVSGTPLFSLASATEPGEFNLQQMGSFSCRGLILFMRISDVADPLAVFEDMLGKATHLAEVLDGELRLGQDKALTEELIKEIREDLRAD